MSERGSGSMSRAIPVIEERLHADAVEVDQGGFRVTKHVDTTTEEVHAELRDFQVRIERRPIGQRLEGLDVPPARYDGDTLVIPVVEEVLVTEKRLLLVEEVRITGVQGTRQDTKSVTLRKESVSIERLAPTGAPEPALPGTAPANASPIGPKRP